MNVNAKRDGWVRDGIKLETDFSDEGIDWEYDEFEVLKIVMQVLKTPYLNRLKQFFFRLIRNNLFLGKRSQKVANSDPDQCFICGKHPEKRVPLLYSCEVVRELNQNLVEVLKRDNLLDVESILRSSCLKTITLTQLRICLYLCFGIIFTNQS